MNMAVKVDSDMSGLVFMRRGELEKCQREECHWCTVLLACVHAPKLVSRFYMKSIPELRFVCSDLLLDILNQLSFYFYFYRMLDNSKFKNQN